MVGHAFRADDAWVGASFDGVVPGLAFWTLNASLSLVVPLSLAVHADVRAVKVWFLSWTLAGHRFRVESEAGRTPVALTGLGVPVVRCWASNAGAVGSLVRLFFRTSDVFTWNTDLAGSGFVGLVGLRSGGVGLRSGGVRLRSGGVRLRD